MNFDKISLASVREEFVRAIENKIRPEFADLVCAFRLVGILPQSEIRSFALLLHCLRLELAGENLEFS